MWLAGLERLLAERGYAAERVLRAEDVPATLARGGPADARAPRPARFAVGDRVRTRNMHPHTHTRLPRYARDKVGTVERVHGSHVFPDSNAHFARRGPAVALHRALQRARAVGHATTHDSVSIDAFEPYLEPA